MDTWLIRRHLPQAQTQTQLQQHRQHARQNRSARCKKKLEANFIKYSWPQHKRQQQRQQQQHEQCTRRRRSSEERRKKNTPKCSGCTRYEEGEVVEEDGTHASHVAACTFLTCLQLVCVCLCVCAAQSRGSFPLLSGKIVSVSLGAAATITTTASTVAAASDKLSFNHLAVYSIFFFFPSSYLCLAPSLSLVVFLFCAAPSKFKACNVCWLDIEILIDGRALYV